MGSDGAGLFSDDTAVDVRDSYREMLQDGTSDEVAESSVLREFANELADPDDRPVVWLSLGYTQSKLGRLSDDVRGQVLAILDEGGDLDRWREAGERAVRQRADVLQRVRDQITGPQPARRRLRRSARIDTPVLPGQVLGYRAPSGLLYLMRVAEIVETKYYAGPVIRFLDHSSYQAPSAEGLENLSDKEPHPTRWPMADVVVIGTSSKDRPEDHDLFTLGTLAGPRSPVPDPNSSTGWDGVVTYLRGRDREISSTCPQIIGEGEGAAEMAGHSAISER